MSGDVSPYAALITSEHNQRPKYMALIAVSVQPFADNIAMLRSMAAKFDLDKARGTQLDTLGLWIGVSRFLTAAITGTGFAWSSPGLGWGQGAWEGSSSGGEVIRLDDAHYRTLLYARVAANHWDGTAPGAYAIWNVLFAGTGYSIEIVDNGDMTMQYGLIGPTPDALTLALFEGGYLDMKPAGVRISSYYTHP